MQKKHSLRAFILASLFFSGSSFSQQVESYSLGLSEPTLSEIAESARTMVRTQKVLPNKLAIERLNTERLLKGQAPVYKIPPAMQGEEILAAFSSSAIGSASDANLGSVALASLPGRVDNSALAAFPPIRSQGDIGSCASFSSTYYVGTHMLALARGTNTKNLADNSNKLSPKFTYALVNGGADRGSNIVRNLQTLVNFGAPTWSSFPYVGVARNSANYLEWPRSALVWRESALNRFKETGVVENINTAAGLENAKALLTNGYLLLFGTDIYGWDMTTFSNDPSTTADNDLVGKQVCRAVENNPSGHAMTVVGYDDNVWTDINRNGVVDAGEKGGVEDRKFLGR
jgi:C1A family cysteine protease